MLWVVTRLRSAGSDSAPTPTISEWNLDSWEQMPTLLPTTCTNAGHSDATSATHTHLAYNADRDTTRTHAMPDK